VLTDELLWTLFKTFDIDDTNFISVQNLREAFHRLGRFEITEE
jgi:Ca2+-binding EF-hand superfamily protein